MPPVLRAFDPNIVYILRTASLHRKAMRDVALNNYHKDIISKPCGQNIFA